MLRSALGTAIAGYWKTTRSSSDAGIQMGGCGLIGYRAALLIPAIRCLRRTGERIVRLVAHHVGAEVHAGSPRGLPNYPGPVNVRRSLAAGCCAPAFAIRKPAVAVFTLDDYVACWNHDSEQASA